MFMDLHNKIGVCGREDMVFDWIIDSLLFVLEVERKDNSSSFIVAQKY